MRISKRDQVALSDAGHAFQVSLFSAKSQDLTVTHPNHIVKYNVKDVLYTYIPTNYPGHTGIIPQKPRLSRYPGITVHFPAFPVFFLVFNSSKNMSLIKQIKIDGLVGMLSSLTIIR